MGSLDSSRFKDGGFVSVLPWTKDETANKKWIHNLEDYLPSILTSTESSQDSTASSEFECARDALFDAMCTGSLDRIKFIYDRYCRPTSSLHQTTNSPVAFKSLFSVRDSCGHTAAHWLALYGWHEIAAFIVEKWSSEAHLVLDLPSSTSQGPRPIHWAARNGHIAVVDQAVKVGINVNARDNKGLTPLMMACMFGRSSMATYLLGRGADPTLTDVNGDSALHWAAYRGHARLVSILVRSRGVDVTSADDFGSLPLHLAAISGSKSTVELILHVSQRAIDSVNSLDRNCKTPLDLAAKHGHDAITALLISQLEADFFMVRLARFIFTCVWSRDGYGQSTSSPSQSRRPIYFLFGSTLGWAYPVYLLRCVPVTWELMPMLHAVFLAANITMWIGWLAAARLNPGYVPKDSPEYENLINELAERDASSKLLPSSSLRAARSGSTSLNSTGGAVAEAGGGNRLCHTCRIIRPLRSKHCRKCDRCIIEYDHHCNYVGNCIASGNRTWFLLFTASLAVVCALMIVFSVVCVAVHGWHLVYAIGLIESILFCGIGTLISLLMLFYASINMTSNEVTNFKRYAHFRHSIGGRGGGGDGSRFVNPFNRGIVANLWHFFCCSPPLSSSGQGHQSDLIIPANSDEYWRKSTTGQKHGESESASAGGLSRRRRSAATTSAGSGATISHEDFGINESGQQNDRQRHDKSPSTSADRRHSTLSRQSRGILNGTKRHFLAVHKPFGF